MYSAVLGMVADLYIRCGGSPTRANRPNRHSLAALSLNSRYQRRQARLELSDELKDLQSANRKLRRSVRVGVSSVPSANRKHAAAPAPQTRTPRPPNIHPPPSR